MTETKLITKFLAWLDLNYKGGDTDLLKMHTNEKGERYVEYFDFIMKKHIYSVDDDPDKAFDKFFEIFSHSVDEYVLDKPSVKNDLEKQIKTLEEKQIEYFRKYKEKRKENKEKYLLQDNIICNQFNDDLDVAMNTLVSSVDDASLIIGADPSNIYFKAIGKKYFEESLSEKEIDIKMNNLCKEEVKLSNNILLFTKCTVRNDFVLLVGVLDKK